MRGKALVAAVMVSVFVAAMAAAGCGGGTKLEYVAEPGYPVAVYQSTQALSPVYNPTAPVAIIYGDGTKISKEDAYSFTTGTLSGDGVPGVLNQLDDLGYFDLDKEYKGEPTAGGATQTMIVYLGKGSNVATHKVVVESGGGPENWDKIVKTVTGAPVASTKPYIPDTVVLFANAATEVPADAKVNDWPGNAEDLEKAAAPGAKGVELTGDDASTAWKAIASEEAGEAYWKAGGKVYTFVYAQPVFQGIENTD